MKRSLKIVLDNLDNGLGARFIQLLIAISVITFSIETLPDLSQLSRTVLWYVELIIVVLFTIEYLLRVIASKSKLGFIFSFYGIVDLLAILPFYITTSIDLRSVRILRLLRLLRLFKFIRYTKTSTRFLKVLAEVKEELIIFSCTAVILLYLSAVGIYYFEHAAQPAIFQSIFHSLWWAVITLTTVGYGDAYPITVGGKIFTSFILMLGLGIVAIPTAIIASSLSTIKSKEEK